MGNALWRQRLAMFLLFSACLSGVALGDADSRFGELARGAGETEPLVRIGLVSHDEVTLSAAGSYRVIDPDDGKAVWRDSFDGELHAVVEGAPAAGVETVYRVQAGAFASEDAAKKEKDRLAQLLGTEGVVRRNPDRGNWRVRMGRSRDRLALNSLMQQMRDLGLADLWIAEEPAQEISGVALRLVDAAYRSQATQRTRLAVIPAKGSRIELNGRSYRGVLELRVTPFGTIRVINWVGLETYLLGVVPAELGPAVWPELHALQAQAVAARTYIWRNLGQFDDEGYDICDTPRCQVYKGYSAEHPLSDRAVMATRGEVMIWQDRPIVALYSATCGGHTEDGSAIFAEHAEPYLKGVPCRAESEAVASLRGTLSGAAVELVVDETGREQTRDWALLRAAGVLGGAEAAARPKARLKPDALRAWSRSLAALAGVAEPSGSVGPVSTLAEAASTLLQDLGWSERAEVLLSGADVPALLRDDEALQLARTQRRALAYLAWVEAIAPFPDGRFGVGERPSAARMSPALARIGEAYTAFGLRKGVISGVGTNSIRLVQGKGEIRLPMAAKPYLFGRAGGKSVAVERLELWPGDRIRFRTAPSGKVDFLELTPPVKGASDDRSAAVYAWDERKTRRELEAAINRRVSIGRLKNLEVQRRGVSGRVVELRVVGSRATTVVRGFDVRRLLDLRDILTVFEIQRDAQGEISAVLFSGKGWGHGVGLCQVGAYGMALRDAKYGEILTHYYSGAKLVKQALRRP